MPQKLPAVSLVAVPGRRRLTLDLAREIERRGYAGIFAPSHVRMGVTPGKPLADIRSFVAKLRGYEGIGAQPPIIRRLRGERPEQNFAISLRSGWDGKDAAELRVRLAAYREVGADHVLVEPGDRDIADWLRSVEKIARAGEGV